MVPSTTERATRFLRPGKQAWESVYILEYGDKGRGRRALEELDSLKQLLKAPAGPRLVLPLHGEAG